MGRTKVEHLVVKLRKRLGAKMAALLAKKSVEPRAFGMVEQMAEKLVDRSDGKSAALLAD